MGGNILVRFYKALRRESRARQLSALHRKYREYTMIPAVTFVANLELCLDLAPASGCVVECGVWRGGMSAAIAEVLPGRLHLLFDSFEGLPPAQEIDGPAAINYQEDRDSPDYMDNCRAESVFAEKAMRMSKAREFRLVKGWFRETLPTSSSPEPIAVLRLDADWYESTMDCLANLYPKLMPGGLILIDDYYTWDGCARAVHDYLSIHSLSDRIQESRGVCFLVKRDLSGRTFGDVHERSTASIKESVRQ